MIIIPAILMIISNYIYYKKNNKIFGIINFLFLIFLGMTLSSIFTYYSGIYVPVLPLSFFAIFFFTAMLLISFKGLSGFRDKTFRVILIENKFFFRALEYILIFGGGAALFFFTPLAIIALKNDIHSNRTAQVNLLVLERYGIITSLAILFSSFLIVMLICAFIELSLNDKNSTLRACLLIIASFSYIVYVFAYVGRDGVVYWILSFIFVYLLLKDFLTKKARKLLLSIFKLLFILFIIPFLIITFARFGDLNESLISMISYYGQQVANFSDKYQIHNKSQRGVANFGAIIRIFESIGFTINAVLDKDIINYAYFTKGAVPWVFSTYIGSFYSDFGRMGSFIIILILFLIGKMSVFKLRRTGVFSFSKLLLFALTYQIISWGVFYFRLSSLNYYLIGMLLLSLLFYFTKTQKDSFRIIKLTCE